MAKLTAKQQRFIEEYLVDLNATQAAIRAGYSPKTARQIAQRMLSKVYIQEALSQAIQDRSKRTQITADQVVAQLAKIAFSDITNFVRFGRREVQVMGAFGPVYEETEDGKKEPVMKDVNYVDFKESNQVDGTIISEVKQGKDGSSVKLNDRMRALELLGKHLGMFNDKVEHSGEVSINITLVDDDDDTS